MDVGGVKGKFKRILDKNKYDEEAAIKVLDKMRKKTVR